MEFVLTILFIMVLIFWALEIIMFVYSYSVLADAAKEGVRYAVVHGSASGSPSGPATGSGTDCSTNVATVQGIVQNYARLTFHNMSGMTVNVCYLDGNNEAPNRVQIRVSYPYSTFFTFWRPPTIRAAAEGRIMF